MQYLSEEITHGLALFCNDKIFKDEVFKKLVGFVFDVLLKKKDESLARTEFEGIDALYLKQAFAALTGFVLEGVKIDADPLLLAGALGERNINSGRTEVFSGLYGEHKQALRELLGYTSFNFPHLVDLDWRMDYHIKSDSLERIDKFLYHITLNTEVGNREKRDISFSCSLEQLQDLVYRLRDATKQFENHMNRLEKTTK